MEFVFSSWIIVAIALLCATCVCLGVFFVMNKKDAKLTDEFVKKQYAEKMKNAEEKKSENN